MVPSDGWRGSIAMLWKEGTVVHFKSCSNSHIDMVVMEEDGGSPLRATNFHGHSDVGMRYSSWDLLKTLHSQAKMQWVVFGDINEIGHLEEKLGWKEREANQIWRRLGRC